MINLKIKHLLYIKALLWWSSLLIASTNEGTAGSSSLRSPIDCHTALVSESEKRSEAHSKTLLVSEALSRAPQFFDYFDKASLQVMERDYVILPMQLAWLAKEHLLMIGAPGNAKTTLAKLTMGQVIDEKSKKPSFFARQMTAETTLTDTHGGLDFKVLNDTGRQRRLYDEGILGSHFGLFDEQFDMRPNGYRNILDVLAERSHSEGPNEHKGITWSVVGASNAMLPEVYAMFNGSEKPRALIDRYAFVLYIPPEMQKVKNQRAIVQASRHQKPALPRLTFQDIEALQKLVPLVEIPDHVADLLGLIHYRLRPLLESTEQSLVQEHNGKVANGEKPLPPFRSTKYQSPRTLDKAAGILKAFVVLEFLKSKGQRPLVASIDDLPVVELFYTLNAPSKDFIESQIKRAQKDVEKEQLRHLKMEREIAEKTIQSTVSEFRETLDHYALTDIHNQVQNYKSLSAYDRRHLMDGLREMYRESHQPEIEDLIDYEPQDVAKLSIVELIEQWVHELVPNRSAQVTRHWLSNNPNFETKREKQDIVNYRSKMKPNNSSVGFRFFDKKAQNLKQIVDGHAPREVQTVPVPISSTTVLTLHPLEQVSQTIEIYPRKGAPEVKLNYNTNHSGRFGINENIEISDGGVFYCIVNKQGLTGDYIYLNYNGRVGRVSSETLRRLQEGSGPGEGPAGKAYMGYDIIPMGPYLRSQRTGKVYVVGHGSDLKVIQQGDPAYSLRGHFLETHYWGRTVADSTNSTSLRGFYFYNSDQLYQVIEDENGGLILRGDRYNSKLNGGWDSYDSNSIEYPKLADLGSPPWYYDQQTDSQNHTYIAFTPSDGQTTQNIQNKDLAWVVPKMSDNPIIEKILSRPNIENQGGYVNLFSWDRVDEAGLAQAKVSLLNEPGEVTSTPYTIEFDIWSTQDRLISTVRFAMDMQDEIDFKNLQYWVENGHLNYVAFANTGSSTRPQRLYYGRTRLDDKFYWGLNGSHWEAATIISNLQSTKIIDLNQIGEAQLFESPRARLVQGIDRNNFEDRSFYRRLFISSSNHEFNKIVIVDLNKL